MVSSSWASHSLKLVQLLGILRLAILNPEFLDFFPIVQSLTGTTDTHIILGISTIALNTTSGKEMSRKSI